jgi:hypothetical protein
MCTRSALPSWTAIRVRGSNADVSTRAVEDDGVADRSWRQAEGAFFETSTILLALVFSGRALEARTKTARGA